MTTIQQAQQSVLGYAAQLTDQYGLPASDPASLLYQPPSGYYQNDAGQLVPNSQANTPATTTPVPNTTSSSGIPLFSPMEQAILSKAFGGTPGAPSISQAAGTPTFFGHSLEDLTIIVVGMILIAAGLFAFKSTQTLITTVGRGARRGAEIAAS